MNRLVSSVQLIHRKVSSLPTIFRAEGFLAYAATDIGLSSIASTPPEVASSYPSPSLCRPWLSECSLDTLFARNFFQGLTSKILSSLSKETPLDSGWKRTQTTTVRRELAPKRKYGPEEERERKKGVVKATTQLTAYSSRHNTIPKSIHQLITISISEEVLQRTDPVSTLA